MSASLNDAALELTMPSLTGRSALSAEQQTELNRQKRHTRLANEKYFRAHPELRVMLGTFMAELLERGRACTASRPILRGPRARAAARLRGWERPEAEAPPEERRRRGRSRRCRATRSRTSRRCSSSSSEADVDGRLLDYKISGGDEGQLGLSSDDVKHLLAEADEDGNGLIEYAEPSRSRSTWCRRCG